MNDTLQKYHELGDYITALSKWDCRAGGINKDCGVAILDLLNRLEIAAQQFKFILECSDGEQRSRDIAKEALEKIRE